MRNGQGFAKKKEYPVTTRVTRVIDGGEPAEFRSLFRDWKVREQTTGFGRQNSGVNISPTLIPHRVSLYIRPQSSIAVGRIAKVAPQKFDVTSLHSNPKAAAQSGMVDDGSGTKQVYRIVDRELSPVPVTEHGQFFAGDCYVINYSYLVGGSERNILYYWLVRRLDATYV